MAVQQFSKDKLEFLQMIEDLDKLYKRKVKDVDEIRIKTSNNVYLLYKIFNIRYYYFKKKKFEQETNIFKR